VGSQPRVWRQGTSDVDGTERIGNATLVTTAGPPSATPRSALYAVSSGPRLTRGIRQKSTDQGVSEMGSTPRPPLQSSSRAQRSSRSVLTLFISSSNNYIKNLAPSPWKAILLSYVVVGKTKKFTAPQWGITGPPAGFDSVRSTSSPFILFVTFGQVIAEPDPAGSFGVGADELVVYSNDAARPIYLLMYDS